MSSKVAVVWCHRTSQVCSTLEDLRPCPNLYCLPCDALDKKKDIMLGGTNSNDSTEFGNNKQLLNEALAKEFGQVFDDTNIDMRFLNKCNDVLRMPSCFGPLESSNIAITTATSAGRSASKSIDTSGGGVSIAPRPRGRPPKVSSDRNLFFEQFFSQAQIQQQFLNNYQHNLQASLLNELSSNNNNNNGAKGTAAAVVAAGGNPFVEADFAEKDVFEVMQDAVGKKHFGQQLEDKLGRMDKDELSPSLNALMTLSNNNTNLVNEAASTASDNKSNLDMSSIDFKLS